MRIAVTGAGGALGGHLVRSLLEDGHEVIAIDIKRKGLWLQVHDSADNRYGVDLRVRDEALDSLMGRPIDQIFSLAASMGGIGWISKEHFDSCGNSVITLNTVDAAIRRGVERITHTSSACCYPLMLQQNPEIVPLKESDAWQGIAERGYGVSKLYDEEILWSAAQDYDIQTRIARLHNIYCPMSTVDGGREKAPAALARKVVEAKLTGSSDIEIWGDGSATRSFCYVDDFVKGISLIMNGEYPDPVNLGSSELVTINQLVDILEDIAGVKLNRHYDLTKPEGVRGRNSDNTLIQRLYNWQPEISLREGMEKTYAWIWDQMKKKGKTVCNFATVMI